MGRIDSRSVRDDFCAYSFLICAYACDYFKTVISRSSSKSVHRMQGPEFHLLLHTPSLLS